MERVKEFRAPRKPALDYEIINFVVSRKGK